MSASFVRRRQRINEVIRWIGAGLGAVCVAGLLGLLQVPELSVALHVACFGFAIGLAGAIGLLALWEQAEDGGPSGGSSGLPELLSSALGAVVGIGAVVAHLNVAAAVTGLCVLVGLVAWDGALLLRHR